MNNFYDSTFEIPTEIKTVSQQKIIQLQFMMNPLAKAKNYANPDEQRIQSKFMQNALLRFHWK